MKIQRVFLLFGLLSVLLTACGSPAKPVVIKNATSVPASTEAAPSDSTEVRPGGNLVPHDVTVVPVPTVNDTPISFPADTAILTWHRQGGIAGFCDDVTVLASGAYTVVTCKDQATQRGQLTESQLLQLTRFVNKLQSFENNNDDPAVADAMSIKTTFKGLGPLEASPEDITTLNNFAALLLIQVKSTGNTYIEPVSKAVDFLAEQLGIAATEIKVTSVEPVEWSDACLGVVIMGMFCAQGITPGYRVVLSAQGTSYELHTNENGDSIQEVKDPNLVKP
jgi:hypothetical protein